MPTNERRKRGKNDLIDAVYERIPVARRDVSLMVDVLLAEIKDALFHDEIVELRGFGTFEVRRRDERRGVAKFGSEERHVVPAHGVAAWKPGKEIRAGVFNLGTDAGGDSAEKGEGDE